MLVCPHTGCQKSIGSPAREGGWLLRLSAVVVSPTGDISGDCPACRASVSVVRDGGLQKALIRETEVVHVRPVLRIG